MKIKSFFLIAINFCIIASHAQDNLKVTLKDGSQLIGYISRQRPGEDFSFTTKKAEISLDATKIKSIIDHRVKWKDLTTEWKKWVKDQGFSNGKNKDSILTLSDIVTNERTISKVRILERGVKVTYLELSQAVYRLSWDTISVIKAEARPQLLLSGVNRKYVLKSGMEYKGQYVKEIPGKTLSLLQDDGTTYVFHRNDVIKDFRYPINANQTLLEQSDLLDIVVLKNGNSEEGVIIERNYSETDTISNDFLLIQKKEGSIQKIKLSDILEYQKKPNSKYNPIMDVDLQVGEIMVDREICKKRAIKEVGDIITCNIDSISKQVSLKENLAEIVIETKLLDSQSISQYKLIKVISYHSKKQKSTIHGFSYESLVKNAIPLTKYETSINQITKMDYQIRSRGIYALYDTRSNSLILFEVI